MKCEKCGAEYSSELIRCPYCQVINEEGIRLATKVQAYDEKFESKRDELLETGSIKTLKKITISLCASFAAILILFGAYIGNYQYHYGDHSKYQVTSSRLKHNKEMLKKYMDEKQYIRAYLLASQTDPTSEYFTYYPEYKKELLAIYSYYLFLYEVRFTLEDMDNGDNYRALTENDLIGLDIFYGLEECDVKAELSEEIDHYLKNLYQLTDEEIEFLKTVDSYEDFNLEGRPAWEVSKERMVAYFGK